MRVEEDARNKHQLKTEEMRRKLLKSARKIFAKDGFEAARLEDIAKDAGHTRGAFYAHFASKEDLFFALLEQQIYRHLEKVQTLLHAESDAKSKLRVLRGYYVERLADPNWSILMLEFKLFAFRHPKVRARLAGAHRAMRASFQVPGLTDLLSSDRSQSGMSRDAMKIVLEGFVQSLILQRAYDPISLSSRDATQALGEVFDLLVGNK
jgi:AcrR family transcriptional regulator